MRKDNLLRIIESATKGKVESRRYTLPDMISESYNICYDAPEDSNLKKLAEAHLEDLRNNPSDIDRLSQQMCNLKHIVSMVESRRMRDSELVEKRRPARRLKESAIYKLGMDYDDDPAETMRFCDEYGVTYQKWKGYPDFLYYLVGPKENIKNLVTDAFYMDWEDVEPELEEVDESKRPIKGRRLKEGSETIKVSKEILADCRDKFKKLKSLLSNKKYKDAKELSNAIKDAFKIVGGRVSIRNTDSRGLSGEGMIGKFDIGINASVSGYAVDMIAEDIIGAYFKTKMGLSSIYTPDFIAFLEGNPPKRGGETFIEESVKYPNGESVSDEDLNTALDYMYGEDRGSKKFTDEEKTKAVAHWLENTDGPESVDEAKEEDLYTEEYKGYTITEKFIPKFAKWMYIIVGINDAYFSSIGKAKAYIDNKFNIDEAKEEDMDLSEEELDELTKHLAEMRKKKGIKEAESPLEGRVIQFGVDIYCTPEEDGQIDEDTISNALEDAGFRVVGCLQDDMSWTAEDYAEECGREVFSFNESKKPIKRSKRLKESKSPSTGALMAKEGSTIIDNKTGKEGVVKKTGASGNYGLLYVDFGDGKLRKINPMDDAQRVGRYELKESKSYKGLSRFSKASSSKAFYKTFKKLDGALREGRALTRKESIDLYKASNSALTQLSIELEHNPKFLRTFSESVSLLSKDVNSLLESLTRGKAPSKKTMKSLAKFSEALLNESDMSDADNDDRWTYEPAGDEWPEHLYFCDDKTFAEYIVAKTDKGYEAGDFSEEGIPHKTFKTKEEAKAYIESLVEGKDEDEEDIDVEETPEEEIDTEDDIDAEEEAPAEDEEFVGDDEGDIESEEADAFDQEYADARVALHKELAEKHADDEDPAIQDKIEQDKEEVLSLDGITDEQVADLTGEEPTEDPEGEDSEEEPEEAPEGDEEADEPEESEEDADISDDELAELKKHLTEMRRARRSSK